MASIATIQISQDHITIDSDGKGSFSFTITNIFGSELNIGAKLVGEDSSTESWGSVAPPVERMLDDQATDTIVIKFELPSDAKSGKYKYSLLVYSVENPSLDFTESDPVSIRVPEPEPEPEPEKFKMQWWMWLIIAVVVVSLIGILIYALSGSKPTNKTILVPAKTFVRGEGVALHQGAALRKYGWGKNVLLNAPPYRARANAAEFEFNAPAGGAYRLSAEYAARDSRPVSIKINGFMAIPNALSAKTGCWEVRCQKWMFQGLVELNKGRNIMRVARPSVFPHIRNFKFELVETRNLKSDTKK